MTRERMTMLRVRGLGKIFDAINDCPKGMAVSIFATVDPDGVIGLRAGIYYDIQSIRVSERSEDLVHTYIGNGTLTETGQKAFLEEFSEALHKQFDTEEI